MQAEVRVQGLQSVATVWAVLVHVNVLNARILGIRRFARTEKCCFTYEMPPHAFVETPKGRSLHAIYLLCLCTPMMGDDDICLCLQKSK